MSAVNITLNDEQFKKLSALALEQRRTPDAQAEVLVIEALHLSLKATPAGFSAMQRVRKKAESTNGPARTGQDD